MNWFRKRQPSKEKEKSHQSIYLLNELWKLKQYSFDKFENETKDRLEQRLVEIENLIELILKDEKNEQYEVHKKKVEELLKEHEILTNHVQFEEKEWDIIKKEIEEVVIYGIEFIKNTNFYPPEYVFDINKLKGMVLDMDEALEKQNNPLLQSKDICEKAKELKEKISVFKELHEKTTQVIKKIDEHTKEGKIETEEMFDLKNELYIYLQQGNLKKAEKTLRKLKRTL